MEIIGIITVLILFNGLIWMFALPAYVEKKIRPFQEELVNRHYDEVENMYRKMRGWRHDYHNHIQVMKAYMAMGKYRETEQYLAGLEQDLATVDTVIKTGNMMMDAILNSKIALMNERKIQVDATAFVPDHLPLADTELAVLLGNLLDNAMEASSRLNPKERFVRIYIDVLKGQLYLSVTNSMLGRETQFGNLFYTTKEGGHGYGLWRVRRIVEKYEGYINQKSEDGVFATEVSIPISRFV